MAQECCGICGIRTLLRGLAGAVLLLVPLSALAFLGAGKVGSLHEASGPIVLERSDDVVAQGLIIHTGETPAAPAAPAAQAASEGDPAEVVLKNWAFTRLPTRFN